MLLRSKLIKLKAVALLSLLHDCILFIIFLRLKVERKRKLLKAKLTKLKEEGGGCGGSGGGGGGDCGAAAVANSPLDETASQAEFRKQKKTKEFR